MEPRGTELIDRYKLNYGILPESDITEQMILTHWELEKKLALDLLRSTPENRWEIFEHCYTRLYDELPWLNQFSEEASNTTNSRMFRRWIDVIGTPPKSIYEVGSGKGVLLSYLAQNGFTCKGTEVTRERGQNLVNNSNINLSWGVSDGVNLDTFESPESYDVVISSQVIEHLHPLDLQPHLKGVYRILKDGGRYIFNTPHQFTGPHDISRVFKLDEPKGMHLKEYTYEEMVEAIKAAGFYRVYYPFIPKKVQKLLTSLGFGRLARTNNLGNSYLKLLLFVEKKLSSLTVIRQRRWWAKILKKLYVFTDNISLVAEKETLRSR